MKMRYFAILLLSAVLLTGCGGGTSTKNGTTAVTTTTESKDKTDLADLMSTQDYSCTVDDSFMYYVMYVTNNSDKVVNIDLNVTALDSSGSMVVLPVMEQKRLLQGKQPVYGPHLMNGIKLIVSITHCRYQRKRNTLLSILTYPLTTILPTAALLHP